MESRCSSTMSLASQKKRIPVTEGLYDFKDEEIDYIHACRLADEESDNNSSDSENGSQQSGCPSENDNASNCEERGQYSYEDCDQDNMEFCYSSQSSIFNFGFDSEDDCNYPVIENSRWITNISTDMVMSPIVKFGKLNTNNESCSDKAETNNHCSENEIPKKIVIPEPELRDPYKHLDFEDSIEKEDNKSIQTIVSNGNTQTTLSQKISTIGRMCSSGGFFGSFVRRSSHRLSIRVETQEIRRNGYFRIWFNKLRNLHFI